MGTAKLSECVRHRIQYEIRSDIQAYPATALRLAIHTPTWYHLTNTTNAWVDYRFDGPDYWLEGNENNNPFATSQQASWNTSMRTPWRFMASVAGVVGGRFILSADYEYNAYKSMSMSYPDDGSFSSINAAQADKQNFENDVKQYYQGGF